MTQLDLETPNKISVSCPLSEEYLLAVNYAPKSKDTVRLPFRFVAEMKRVWAETNPPGLALHQVPIIVQLTSYLPYPMRNKQYLFTLEVKKKK